MWSKRLSMLLLLVSTGAIGLENRLPDGFDLKGRIQFEFDEESCGEMEFRLDQNDDCTIEFLDFWAATDFVPVRSCQLKIIVDVPEGLRMAPSIFSIEGEYQIGKNGLASLEADYGVEGFDGIHIGKTYHGNDDDGLVSEAFLLQGFLW